MESEIQRFDFNGHAIRTVIGPDGEHWWIAGDVCRVLDIGNPTEALRRLDPDEKTTLSNTEGRVGHGPQSFNIVSESGLYSLIMTSRKPEARQS